MTQITEQDKQAGFKDVSVSFKTGAVLQVRVVALTPRDVFALAAPTNEKLDSLIAKTISRDVVFVKRMTEVSHADIMAVCFELMSIDLGDTSALLAGARKSLASKAPRKI